MVIERWHLRCALAAAAGAAVTTAHPLGVAAAIAMPGLALSQETKRHSYAAGLSYYGAALWPLIPAARNFFGLDFSALTAVALWAISAMLLALPWMLVWSPNHIQGPWRAPLGLALTLVPPLGIIGWASPLTAAGVLFPGTAWLGLVLCAVSGGALAARPRLAAAVLATFSLVSNVVVSDAQPLPGWQAVDTLFGGIAHGSPSPIQTYETAEWIQREALDSKAEVIVFPETVVPTWTPATDEFWQPTLDQLQSSGKTILVGARMPTASHSAASSLYDFSADLAALSGAAPRMVPAIDWKADSTTEPSFAYDNGLILRGAQDGLFQAAHPRPHWHVESTEESGGQPQHIEYRRYRSP